MNKNKPQLVRHIVYGHSQYPHSKPIRFLETEMSSNLPLQKILYFNVNFSPIYFYMILCAQVYKSWVFKTNLVHVLRIIFTMIWGLLEIFRLRNGYEGNVKESFPEIYSFFLLTILNLIFQVLTIILPMFSPLEYTLVVIQCIFSALAIVLSSFEMLSANRSKILLLGSRAPPDNREIIMKKQIDTIKFESQFENKNKEEEQGYDENIGLTQQNGYNRIGQF